MSQDLRTYLLQQPGKWQRGEYYLTEPVHIKILARVIDWRAAKDEDRWFDQTIIAAAVNCYFRAVGGGKPWWAIKDWKTQ